jgi:glucokinase
MSRSEKKWSCAMAKVEDHVLVVDLGGTNATVAVFAYHGEQRFTPIISKTYPSPEIRDFPALLQDFLSQEAAGLKPAVTRACIDFAGPIEPTRQKACPTNLNWEFTVPEVLARTGLKEIFLLNDFEAVGYGLEVLAVNRPDAFVRLSSSGVLPGKEKPTAVIIGAGTGLGTSILVRDPRTNRYRPVSGEGGHADFQAVEEIEWRISDWIRRHRNNSASNPADIEKVVSGPGLANLYEALQAIQPGCGGTICNEIMGIPAADRPAAIVKNAALDPLCRQTLDLWIRCYARAAKHSALFPLAPGGVFLAGGIAAKIVEEFQRGSFMEEFTRCDLPGIRALLQNTPVFIIMDYAIGLFGCASVAVSRDLLA